MRVCQYARCGKPVDTTAPWGLAFCEQHTLDKPRGRKQRKKRALPELSPTCGKGHVFTEETTYLYANGRRKCKTCAQEYRDRHMSQRCSKGHEYTPENTGVNKAGQRRCLTCNPVKGELCRKGHVLTKSNIMVDGRGAKRCLDCKHERELSLVVPPMKHKGNYPLRCDAGHLFTKRITRFDTRGNRICTECEKAA